jgi:exodeoxyribonuclease VII large subunit
MTAAQKPAPKPYTVSALTENLKRVIEGGFTKIYVEAEISGWRLYPSGHAYFTLKDGGAQISAVMFASALGRCRARASLRDGAKVVVYGNVSVYAPRGNYQFVALAAKLVGEGDLMQRYLELKAKLEAEGLFDKSRKRRLPFLPRRIGIVTSEAGAVIHDMCNVLFRRFPGLHVRLFPALVQGDGAPAELAAGIGYFQREFDADLLIIARGGGSFEDLFCFNDETLVRAVASSAIPVISAVGHETDFTLCDFAADIRAGTPSIAAEIAVPVKDELVRRLDALKQALAGRLERKGEWFAQRLDQLSDSLAASLTVAGADAASRLERVRPRLASSLKVASVAAASRLERLGRGLVSAVDLRVVKTAGRLDKARGKLDALSPYAVLDRGYSLTSTESGEVVKDASSLSPGMRITTRYRHGRTVSEVLA